MENHRAFAVEDPFTWNDLSPSLGTKLVTRFSQSRPLTLQRRFYFHVVLMLKGSLFI